MAATLQPAGETAPNPHTNTRLMPTSCRIKVAFTPPKPKELDSTTFTRASWGWRTIGKLQAGSGVSRAVSGGSHCSRKAIRQTTASTAPAAAQQMADAGFGGADRQRGGSRPGPAIDGGGFCAVVEQCAGAMGVNVINIRRAHAGALASQRHGRHRAVSLRLGLGEMIGINGGAVADEFGQDDSASPARAVERFEGKDRRAFAQGQAIAPRHRTGGRPSAKAPGASQSPRRPSGRARRSRRPGRAQPGRGE